MTYTPAVLQESKGEKIELQHYHVKLGSSRIGKRTNISQAPGKRRSSCFDLIVLEYTAGMVETARYVQSLHSLVEVYHLGHIAVVVVSVALHIHQQSELQEPKLMNEDMLKTVVDSAIYKLFHEALANSKEHPVLQMSATPD